MESRKKKMWSETQKDMIACLAGGASALIVIVLALHLRY